MRTLGVQITGEPCYGLAMENENKNEELLGSYGDPRRCRHHPHVRTSSADGMHDAPCGECEFGMEAEEGEEEV